MIPVFLHTFQPSPIMLSFGPINIYWYGFFIVLGVISALLIAMKLGSYYGIKKETVIDLAFYLVIFGVIGARVYDVFFVEWSYFSGHLLDIFKVWQGGLAIHGAVIAGVITLYFFAKKTNPLNLPAQAGPPLKGGQENAAHLQKGGEGGYFWLLASILVPGLALAQAIGRWGNYFNQELFGGPTGLPWGIPISIVNRPIEYLSSTHFHPAFLYESLGNLLIFVILIIFHVLMIRNKIPSASFSSRDGLTPFWKGGKLNRYALCVMSYAISYSILRFFTEFIRIDPTPEILGLRLPQIVSLLVVIFSVIFLILKAKKAKTAD